MDYFTCRPRNSQFSERPSKKVKNNLGQNRYVRNVKNYNKFRDGKTQNMLNLGEILRMAG